MLRDVNRDLIIPPEWEEILTGLAGRETAVIYILGPTDVGKTTLSRYLVAGLAGHGLIASLDADTGQSTIGPPSTAGLAICTGTPPRRLKTVLRFVGSTSPQGHMLQHLVSTARLLTTARGEGARYVIIDSPGWVEGTGAEEFQVRMIDLLMPDVVIAIGEKDDLLGILANFRSQAGITLFSIRPSPHVTPRSRGWRTAYRREQFRSYFTGHTGADIPLEGTGFHGNVPESFRDDAWQNLLVGLLDPEMQVVTLAVVEQLDVRGGVLRVRIPPADLSRIASVQVGSIRLGAGFDRVVR